MAACWAGLLVAPLVFQAPEAPAAREARRPHFVRRRASKPALALPPPTGTVAVPSGPSGALHTGGAWCADVWLGASARSPARPRHRPPAPRQIPPTPSTPVGPGHCSAALRVVSKPSQAPRLDVFPILSFACNSPATLSNREFTTLELQRFQTLLKLHPIELHAKFLVGVCAFTHGYCSQAPQPGPPVPSNPSNRSALGRESPKTQTTSVKMGEFGVFWARWSVFWAHGGYE